MREKWAEITSFSNPLYHLSIGEATNHCIQASTGGTNDSGSGNDADVGGGDESPSTTFKYDFKDAILYALSLGYSTKDPNGLKFLYEGHSEFSILPMYGVIPAFSILYNVVASFKLPENLTINPAKILHGEHYLEVFQPFKSSDRLMLKASLADVLDKGSGFFMSLS